MRGTAAGAGAALDSPDEDQQGQDRLQLHRGRKFHLQGHCVPTCDRVMVEQIAPGGFLQEGGEDHRRRPQGEEMLKRRWRRRGGGRITLGRRAREIRRSWLADPVHPWSSTSGRVRSSC